MPLPFEGAKVQDVDRLLEKQQGRGSRDSRLEQKELRKLSRGDVDRRGSTSKPMDICFGRLQATSEGTGLGQGQDISVVLTKVDKGKDKVDKVRS